MGIVYKAEDTRLQRTVAIKLLLPEFSDEPEAKERLLREARAASAFQHQNICTMHEIGETEDGQVFLCMDYYEGETLQDRLSCLQAAGSPPMPLSDIVDVASQIAQGLAKAHEKGIIHRDIKPANIFITGDGVMKLLDFGLARFSGKSKLTQTGRTLGTIAYLSPEQAGGKQVDTRTDIWSLGVVLYEMCTGKTPFEHDVDAAVIYGILDKTPVAPSTLGANIPEDLEKAIFRCLEKDPRDRYQSVRELLEDLDGIWKTSVPDDQRSAKQERKHSVDRPGIPGKRRLLNRWSVIGGTAIVTLLLCVMLMLPRFGPGNRTIQSIAILPFENLTRDSAQGYFVSGIHEELLTNLAKIKSLKVIARSSVMQFERTQKPASAIARDLNVEALVEGSVLRVNGHVRINVQLVDGSTDRQLWAESYDRDVHDVLTMLSEVAQAITREISVNITREETNQFALPHPINLEAHEEYFKGQYLLHQLTLPGYQQALTHFEKATEIDSSFAPAYAGQASVYFLLGFFGIEPYPEVFPKSRTLAMKALEINDGVGEAHSALSWIKLCYDWDWPGAAGEAQRALSLNPGDVIARHVYADYLTVMGHAEEGLRQVVLAREYDPLSPIAVIPPIFHLRFVHRYNEMILECRKLLAMNPSYPNARGILRDGLWLNGNYEEAIVEYQKTWGRDPEYKKALDRGYRTSGPKGALKELASTLARRSKPYTGASLTVATLYALIDEKDPAFVWLEKACEERSPFLVHLVVSPSFGSLRRDPRFHPLLKRFGFPEIQ
jgi:serine/threonine protein kinase/tetratricopeptide (TPR) repeat protein